MATVYERICLQDWFVEAENGDRQDCKRGETYTVSAPREDGTVRVFSRFWVSAPDVIFEPFNPALQSLHRATYAAQENPNG